MRGLTCLSPALGNLPFLSHLSLSTVCVPKQIPSLTLQESPWGLRQQPLTDCPVSGRCLSGLSNSNLYPLADHIREGFKSFWQKLIAYLVLEESFINTQINSLEEMLLSKGAGTYIS
ncbi:hypothetical protein OTU49_015731 [Cherax quadricarinatus]|uniref:Uncharacterized protein n=1 Tax=Cherax quadricarinatus TaxID=27406 RepID=A0AAW0YRS8_CHEQU